MLRWFVFLQNLRLIFNSLNLEFGLYVDKHGNPNRSGNTIEWEGNAERVAYHPPYILIFDSRFIEIRHIETGRLAQIIPGNDIRCIWDGRGVGTHMAHAKDSDENTVQEAQVHAVMNVVESPGSGTAGHRPPKVIAQNVVELIPTLPLYLPGSTTVPAVPDKEAYNLPKSYFSPTSPETPQASYSRR